MDEENLTTEFPEEYKQVLDEVIEQESFTTPFQEQGAEFVSARTVKVPEMVFDGGTDDYDRFVTKGEAAIKYTSYKLDKDRQKSFYNDALDVIDQPLLGMTNIASQFERTLLVPEIDTYFFGKAKNAAKTKATTNLTAANIKAELRNARTQIKQAGYSTACLYMSSEALACLEDSLDREFSGEGVITDTVGTYNFFEIFELPDERIGDADFIAIGKSADKNLKPIRFVWKRAVTKYINAAINQNGDGDELQMRWVYGTIALKNKAAGIYMNKGAKAPDCSVRPVKLVLPVSADTAQVSEPAEVNEPGSDPNKFEVPGGDE